VADAAGAFGTALRVEGLAVEERAAEDIAEVGEAGEEAVEFGRSCAICVDGYCTIYIDDTQLAEKAKESTGFSR